MLRVTRDAPPACNTGVARPLGDEVGGSNAVTMGIDWLRCRLVADERVMGWLRENVPWGVWESRGRGHLGFYDTSAEIAAGGVVAWCSLPSKAAYQGVVVDLSSQALTAWSWVQLVALMRYTFAGGGRVTRLDMAYDDRQGLLTFDRIQQHLEVGAYVSTSLSRRTIESWNAQGKHGFTFYFGSRESDVMVRIYDKAVEQGCEGHWVRAEVEYKAAAACAVAVKLLEGDINAVVADLSARCRFMALDGGRVRRRGVVGWWRAFCGAIAAHRIRREAVCPQGLESTLKWIRKSVAPTLDALLELAGGDLGPFLDLVRGESPRRSVRLNRLVQESKCLHLLEGRPAFAVQSALL